MDLFNRTLAARDMPPERFRVAQSNLMQGLSSAQKLLPKTRWLAKGIAADLSKETARGGMS
jgi:hypothetical protein